MSKDSAIDNLKLSMTVALGPLIGALMIFAGYFRWMVAFGKKSGGEK